MAEIAVVTGASSGIGRALALEMAKRGWEPLLVARRAEKLDEVAKAVRDAGGKPHVLPIDVCAPDAPEKMLARAESLGTPVVLANNAGFGLYGRFIDIPREKLRSMMDLNIRALVEATHAFVPGFLERKKGHVLNIASTAGLQCGPYNQVYAATKSFVILFTEGLAVELRGTGASATVLCPGPTESEFYEIGDYAKMALAPSKAFYMSAEDVARIGVRAMVKKKAFAIAGMQNALGALGSKLGPRAIVARSTGWMFRPKAPRG